MSTVLAADDMRVGQCVTIHHLVHTNKELAFEMETPFYGFSGIIGSGIMGAKQNDNFDKLSGELLKIKALCFPYVIVETLSGAFKGRIYKLDIRNISLMRLNKGYIQTIKRENL
jgi:hypothetical protein